MNLNLTSVTVCLDDTMEKADGDSSKGKFKKCSSDEF